MEIPVKLKSFMIRPILEKIATRRRLENKAIFFFYLIFLSPSSNSNLYVGVYAAAAHELSTFVRMTCVCIGLIQEKFEIISHNCPIS